MQRPERHDREWEQWPGRAEPTLSTRRPLRSLFSSTSRADDELETVIELRSRELEEQTARLAETIADLEQRERRTQELQASVEEMLRAGSTELDQRQASLGELAAELASREQALAEGERLLEARRSELGAVELRRASVERREEALADRQRELDELRTELSRRIEETELRSRTASEQDANRTAPDSTAHVLLLVTDRYTLRAADGPAPPAGSSVDVDGQSFRVTRVGRSPLPGDRRPCAFLEPTGPN